ncbi:MAG: ADOP family duplicated permease [Acidobacteriota bacterium]
MTPGNVREEIDAHIEEKALDLIESGVPEQEAWRRARLEFGNPAVIAESSREMWTWRWLDRLAQDVRYALRQMRRSPGFTTVVVLSLALGIGANTAVFSVMDALLLRRLPVADPDRLVFLDQPFLHTRMNVFAYGWLERFRHTDMFSYVSGINSLERFNLAVSGPGGTMIEQPDRTIVDLVSGTYFPMLGVGAVAGRTLTPDDDRTPGGHPVAVISHRFWRSRLDSAADVAGRLLEINGVIYTIVGVAPPGFLGDAVGMPTDVWIPMSMQSQLMPERPGLLENPSAPWIRIVARLRPGVTLAQTRQRVSEIAYQTEKETQPDLTREDFSPPGVLPASRGDSPLKAIFRDPLQVMLIIVGLLLLIACANIVNLLLARSATRQREIAVRVSLGAGRPRIVRQLLTENFLLASVAGAVAVVIGLWGAQILERMLSSGEVQLQLDIRLNSRLFWFTMALGTLTALVVGLAPAWRSSVVTPSPGLKGMTTSARRAAGISSALIVVQVALVLVLLVGAGLFVQTLRNLKEQDLGFERSVWLIRTAPSEIGRRGPAIADEYRAIQDRLKTLPGVVAVGISTSGLMARTGGARLTIRGYMPQAGETMLVDYNLVGTDYFAAVGMKVLAGRVFSESDNEFAPGVAIVNETLARRYFGRPDVIGKTFSTGRDGSGTSISIVGVVKDAKYALRDDGVSMFFLPARQDLTRLRRMDIAVRVGMHSPSLGTQIRDAIHALDAALPILSVEPVEQTIDRTLLQERLTAWLSTCVGLVVVLLASIGLYGVLSHAVTQRTNEIGVRLALGATAANVSTMVIRWILMPVLLGVALGIPAALIGGRGLADSLYAIQPSNVPTLAGASVLLLVVTTAASFFPARRASRVDPMVALRHE